MHQEHVLQFVLIDALHVGIAVQVLENKTPKRKQSWSNGGHSMGSPKLKIRILAAEVLQKLNIATPPSMGSAQKNKRHQAWECHF